MVRRALLYSLFVALARRFSVALTCSGLSHFNGWRRTVARDRIRDLAVLAHLFGDDPHLDFLVLSLDKNSVNTIPIIEALSTTYSLLLENVLH